MTYSNTMNLDRDIRMYYNSSACYSYYVRTVLTSQLLAGQFVQGRATRNAYRVGYSLC